MSAALAWTAAGARRVRELHPAFVLAPVVAAHFAVVAAIGLTAEHHGWVFRGGEDAAWEAARALGRLDLSGTGAYGAPVLLWPFALADARPAVVLLQVGLGGPLILLALYGIASRLAGRLLGYAAAAAWVIAPLLTLGFFYSGERTFQGIPYDDFRGLVHDTVLPSALGLTVGPGFPSLVALAVAAWLVVRSLDAGDWNDVVLAGLVAGFAIGLRPLNALFLPAPLLVLAAGRRWRQAAGFGVALLPAIATLALWRWAGQGRLDIEGLPFSRYELWVNRVHVRGAGWSLLLVAWIAVAGSFAFIRKSTPKGLLPAAWFAAFFVLGSGSFSRGRVLDGSLFALLEGAYPAFVLLAVGVLLLVPPFGRRRPEPAAPPRPPRLSWGLGAAAVLLAAYPLAMVAVALPGA